MAHPLAVFGGIAFRNNQLFAAHGVGRASVALLDSATLANKNEFPLRDESGGPFSASGIAVGPAFTIHVADPVGRAVRAYSIFGKPLARFGAPPEPRFPVAADRRGVLAEPVAVDVDERGNVYVASAGGPRVHAIQKFTGEGRYLGSFRAFGCVGECFNSPRALVLSQQLLYVADTGNGAIHIYQRSGRFRQVFSTAARHGERSSPVSIALEGTQQLLVLDRGDSHELRRFSRGGEYLGPALPDVVIEAPVAVAAGDHGILYIADRDGERLRAFHPGGARIEALPPAEARAAQTETNETQEKNRAR
jgi:hypothetical protein